MAKQINFTYNGVDYTLEFTRNTVRRMERAGFDVQAAEKAPMTAVYDLLEGALRAHHPNTDKRIIDGIFNQMGDLSGWGDDFIEMYKDTFETLSGGEGEIQRTKNW